MERPTKKRRSSLGRECACFGCTNAQYFKDGSSTGLRFFKFPQQNPKRNRWCNLIKRQHNRDGFSVNAFTVICEKHFKSEDIYKTPGGNRCRLKEGAEPLIFQWQSIDLSKAKRPPPRQRKIPEKESINQSPNVESQSNMSTNEDPMEIEGSIDLSLLDNGHECNDSVCVTLENEDLQQQSTKETNGHDKAVQTVMTESSTSTEHEHSYSFSYCANSTFGEQQEYIKRLEERIEEQSVQINTLKTEFGHLKKQVDDLKKKKFSLFYRRR